MLRLSRLLALSAAVALAAAAAAQAHVAGPAPVPRPPLASAGGFLLLDLREKADGRWGVAWRDLYPLHRRLVAQATYERCERRTPIPAPLRSARVLAVRRQPVRVAGLARPVDGVAVTVQVELGWYGPRDPIAFSHTFHLVPVGERWTWLLSPEWYRLFRAGACGRMPAV